MPTTGEFNDASPTNQIDTSPNEEHDDHNPKTLSLSVDDAVSEDDLGFSLISKNNKNVGSEVRSGARRDANACHGRRKIDDDNFDDAYITDVPINENSDNIDGEEIEYSPSCPLPQGSGEKEDPSKTYDIQNHSRTFCYSNKHLITSRINLIGSSITQNSRAMETTSNNRNCRGITNSLTPSPIVRSLHLSPYLIQSPHRTPHDQFHSYDAHPEFAMHECQQPKTKIVIIERLEPVTGKPPVFTCC
ncbi:unnamed protein product [Ambrosiozyma monospora]|uniref:Unnamed protein product n=1 Tax=Ambrosiozyma monospora TaxID=43982 RepID=A0ACB5U5S2_AMBMO|nr:unnamed protein product [Ambrosiozyma monospora]